MNQEPDNYEDDRQSGGAVAWLFLALLLLGVSISSCALHKLILNKQPPAEQAVTTERF